MGKLLSVGVRIKRLRFGDAIELNYEFEFPPLDKGRVREGFVSTYCFLVESVMLSEAKHLKADFVGQLSG